ncbi:unnamed protein product [Psylliodes chrysocephalus]|uniref:Small acidic protein-like domain-containing protein n=1 Tax=Psylliodes chrysocephalus TaxID=3402493 RepID=A0A9P0GFS8_9CUCU|nr:unnamed protein product [Psylliodes chrysocephala]
MNSLMNYGSDDDDSPEERTMVRSDRYGVPGRNYRKPSDGGGGCSSPHDDTNYDEVQMSLSEDSDAESKSTSKYRRDRDDQRNSPKQRESRDTSLRDRKDDRPDRDNRYGGRDRNEDRNRKERDDDRGRSRDDDRARSRDDDRTRNRDGDRAKSRDDDRARSRDDDRARSRDDDRIRSRDDDRARSRDDDRAKSRDDDRVKSREDDKNRDRHKDRDDDKRDNRRDDRRPRSRDRERYSSRDDRYRQDRDRRRSRSPRDSRERRRSRSPRRSRSRSRDRPARGGFQRRFDRGNRNVKNDQRPGNNPADASQAEDAQNKDRFFMPGITGRFRDQIEKRKLLWQKKDGDTSVAAQPAVAAPSVVHNPNTPRATKVWESTTFAQDTDGKQANKFKRLMGIRAPSDGANSATEVLKKQDEMFSAMEQQYEVARTTTHTMRGVGLGFSSYNR